MLIQAEHAETLETTGYVVIDLLDPAEVAELRTAWEHTLTCHPPQWDPTGMATTVRHPESDLQADTAIQAVARRRVEALWDDEKCFFSAFITKQPGSARLPPHLDWSLLDEREHRTYGCWIALEDTTTTNGALEVVEGSHLLVDFERTPADPGHRWVDDLIAGGARLTLVPMRAGQAAIFDHRLVHGSTPNQRTRRRPAANVALAPGRNATAAREQLLAFMRVGSASQLSAAKGPAASS